MVQDVSLFYLTYSNKKDQRIWEIKVLQIIENPHAAQWYKNLRMGENTIGDIMKNMKTNSPLAADEKKMTNHSARKTAVKKMQRKGLSRSDIIAITGHALEKGLDSYSDGDERQQKTLSNIIDGITPNSRPSQGCFTADHQSPSVLTAPARRPKFKTFSRLLHCRSSKSIGSYCACSSSTCPRN